MFLLAQLVPQADVLLAVLTMQAKNPTSEEGFYNGRRPHSSLDRRTPDQVYFTPLPIRMAA